MNQSIIALATSVLACIIGLWKYFSGKDRVKKEKMNEAKEIIAEGINKDDTSKITIGFDRLRNIK